MVDLPPQQWRSIDGGRKMETPIFWMVFKRPYLHAFRGISMSAWKSLAISSRLVDPLTKDPNTQQVASRKLFPQLAPTSIHHLSFTQTMNKNITFHSPNKKRAPKKKASKKHPTLPFPSLPQVACLVFQGSPFFSPDEAESWWLEEEWKLLLSAETIALGMMRKSPSI